MRPMDAEIALMRLLASGRNPPSTPLPRVSDERPQGRDGPVRLDAQHASATRPAGDARSLLFCSFAPAVAQSHTRRNPRNHTRPRPHAPTYTRHLSLQCGQPRSLLQGSPSGWLHRLNQSRPTRPHLHGRCPAPRHARRTRTQGRRGPAQRPR